MAANESMIHSISAADFRSLDKSHVTVIDLRDPEEILPLLLIYRKALLPDSREQLFRY